MRPRDAEVGEQFRHQRGGHRGAAVCVDCVRDGALEGDYLLNEFGCQLSTFVHGSDP